MLEVSCVFCGRNYLSLIPHPTKPQRFQHPHRQRFFWLAAFEQVEVPADFFQDGDFVCFHKFDERAVGVFDVRKIARRLAHVERAARIHRERVAFFGAKCFHLGHAHDVETQVNVAEVAPKPVFKNLAWNVSAFGGLEKFDFRVAEQAAERSFAFFGVAQQHPPVAPKTAVYAVQIGEFAGDVVHHRVVAKYFGVEFQGFFHVRHADDGAVHAPRQAGAAFGKPVFGAHHLKIVAPQIFQEKVFAAVGAQGDATLHIHPAFAQVVEASLHIFAFYFGDKNTEVAELGLKGRGHGHAAGVLPDFHAAAALQIQGQNGVAVAWFAAGIGQHQARRGRFFKNRHVHAKVLPIPFEGIVDIGDADADLLDSRDKHFEKG